MKYVITESQEQLLYFLRRIHTKELLDHLYDIIYEGFDYTDPCDYMSYKDGFGDYVDEIIRGSIETFLLSYLDTDKYEKEKLEQLRFLVSDLIRRKFFRMIESSFIEAECDEDDN
jgi:hypothetical protein